ncbi:MAG: V-type ATP synthase subunit D [Candidatus Schekmanbacteria bacterium]|nr:V-type ATP synthase subunit D [Candidatus Schekmanbacteria bacterium]
MARKFKLNKSELTRLRRDEKIYLQFLPVLKLKQEQLQIEQLKLRRELQARAEAFEQARAAAASMISLLPEPLPLSVRDLVKAQELVIGEKSVAGVRVPTLERVVFPSLRVSRFGNPPWVLRALPRLRTFVQLNTEIAILNEQYRLIGHELRKATQKVNLFEKVLIPETKEAVRRIKIALGDQQVAAVCRGKIAKGKQQAAAAAAAV